LNPTLVRFAVALAAGPVVLTLLAAFAARWRAAAGVLLVLAIACGLAGAVLLAGARLAAPAFDVPLFAWSPLGLYGVTFVVRPSAAAVVLGLPFLALAAAGTASRRGTASLTARAGEASALVALAAAFWCGLAGDLVSLFLGVACYLLATTGVVAVAAGAPQAGRRLVIVETAVLGLLACVLLLGKINGQFQLAQLSTVGFTWAAFAGVVLVAAVAAPLPPFHGWLIRAARHRLAPALAAAGIAIALQLLLVAFRTTDGQFTPGWQRALALGGWVAVLVSAGIALIRRGAPLRFAALFTGRSALVFLAASVATPAALAAGLLYVTLGVPALGLLWLLSRERPLPATVSGRQTPTLPAARARRIDARTPGFWAHALLLASAAGLPFTLGGVATEALAGALISWPSGTGLNRLPPLIVGVTTLVVAAPLLWRPHRLSQLGGWRGWLALGVAVVLLIGPAINPPLAIGQWFGPAAAVAAGTSGAPLMLDVSRRPTVLSALLGLMAVWALVQRLRGREWLPAIARAALGAVALGWLEMRRRWRARGIGRAPAAVGETLWARAQGIADRGGALLRPLEERYYAATAVLLAVAVIYIVGR
jgi:hypothetical protein